MLRCFIQGCIVLNQYAKSWCYSMKNNRALAKKLFKKANFDKRASTGRECAILLLPVAFEMRFVSTREAKSKFLLIGRFLNTFKHHKMVLSQN